MCNPIICDVLKMSKAWFYEANTRMNNTGTCLAVESLKVYLYFFTQSDDRLKVTKEIKRTNTPSSIILVFKLI